MYPSRCRVLLLQTQTSRTTLNQSKPRGFPPPIQSNLSRMYSLILHKYTAFKHTCMIPYDVARYMRGTMHLTLHKPLPYLPPPQSIHPSAYPYTQRPALPFLPCRVNELMQQSRAEQSRAKQDYQKIHAHAMQNASTTTLCTYIHIYIHTCTYAGPPVLPAQRSGRSVWRGADDS